MAESMFSSEDATTQMTAAEDEGETFEVENVIDRRIVDGGVQYRIRWRTFPPDMDTWEPEEHLEESCQDLIQDFLARNPPEPGETKMEVVNGDVTVEESPQQTNDTVPVSLESMQRPEDESGKKSPLQHVLQQPQDELMQTAHDISVDTPDEQAYDSPIDQAVDLPEKEAMRPLKNESVDAFEVAEEAVNEAQDEPIESAIEEAPSTSSENSSKTPSKSQKKPSFVYVNDPTELLTEEAKFWHNLQFGDKDKLLTTLQDDISGTVKNRRRAASTRNSGVGNNQKKSDSGAGEVLSVTTKRPRGRPPNANRGRGAARGRGGRGRGRGRGSSVVSQSTRDKSNDTSSESQEEEEDETVHEPVPRGRRKHVTDNKRTAGWGARPTRRATQQMKESEKRDSTSSSEDEDSLPLSAHSSHNLDEQVVQTTSHTTGKATRKRNIKSKATDESINNSIDAVLAAGNESGQPEPQENVDGDQKDQVDQMEEAEEEQNNEEENIERQNDEQQDDANTSEDSGLEVSQEQVELTNDPTATNNAAQAEARPIQGQRNGDAVQEDAVNVSLDMHLDIDDTPERARPGVSGPVVAPIVHAPNEALAAGPILPNDSASNRPKTDEYLPVPVNLNVTDLEELFKEELRAFQREKIAKPVSQEKFETACLKGDVEVVRGAIQAMHERKNQYSLDVVSPIDAFGNTLLMTVASRKCDAAHQSDDMLEYLVNAGADINCRNQDGQTALHLAVLCQQLCKVNKLLSLGAAVNLQDKHTITPLVHACAIQATHIVARLLEAGADYNMHVNFASPPTVPYPKMMKALDVSEIMHDHRSIKVINEHNNRVTQAYDSAVSTVVVTGGIKIKRQMNEAHIYALVESDTFRVILPFEPSPRPNRRYGYIVAIGLAKFHAQQVQVVLWGPSPIEAVEVNGKVQQSLTSEANFLYACWPLVAGQNQVLIKCKKDVKQSQMKIIVQVLLVLLPRYDA